MENFVEWDPLESTGGADPGILISAQKREITNILKSYTGYYDVFAELLQNALDAVEKRLIDERSAEAGRIWVCIDLNEQSVQVTDNGCGMDLQQFRQFLRPNFSFKSGSLTRGSKGVGATYLGYGFNSLLISTRRGGKTYSGRIENGRDWIEDATGTIARPKIVQTPPPEGPFKDLSTGTSIKVQFVGQNIRPKNLSWTLATTAEQWSALLRVHSPLGGIYVNGTSTSKVHTTIRVVGSDGLSSEVELKAPEYLFPHTLVKKSGDLREFLKDRKQRAAKGLDVTQPPAKFMKLNGLWGQWTTAELLKEADNDSPIQLRLDDNEKALARSAGVSIYVYLAFSTDLWDNINDTTLKLRKGSRLLRGGLQLATRHMPQGLTLTIPMTNNIGFQNLAHVIVHFDNAEPDLGRKGFQPEYVQLAEKIAVSAVTAFRRRYHLLRKPGVASIFNDELHIEQWIREQEEHETSHALTISGRGLFMPSEELPIRSEPRVEQDVVALFNQMLSSGLIRGIQLIASSQYNQYDGLYRVKMLPPFDKFIQSDDNPLGLDHDFFEQDRDYITKIKVLEYKYSLDGLVEELQSEVKSVADIGLVVAWDMGKKWKEMFDITSLLDPDHTHHRNIHGSTHYFTHSTSGLRAFEAIILSDLVNFLRKQPAEIARQKLLYGDDEP